MGISAIGMHKFWFVSMMCWARSHSFSWKSFFTDELFSWDSPAVTHFSSYFDNLDDESMRDLSRGGGDSYLTSSSSGFSDGLKSDKWTIFIMSSIIVGDWDTSIKASDSSGSSGMNVSQSTRIEWVFSKGFFTLSIFLFTFFFFFLASGEVLDAPCADCLIHWIAFFFWAFSIPIPGADLGRAILFVLLILFSTHRYSK